MPAGTAPITKYLQDNAPQHIVDELLALSSSARNHRYRSAQQAFTTAVVITSVLYRSPLSLANSAKIEISLCLLDGVSRVSLGNNNYLYRIDTQSAADRKQRKHLRDALKRPEVLRFGSDMLHYSSVAQIAHDSRDITTRAVPGWWYGSDIETLRTEIMKWRDRFRSLDSVKYLTEILKSKSDDARFMDGYRDLEEVRHPPSIRRR